LEKRAELPGSSEESEEEVMRWIDDVLNDPKKLRKAVEARIDKVVTNWPKH
jgi:hypothetical protein